VDLRALEAVGHVAVPARGAGDASGWQHPLPARSKAASHGRLLGTIVHRLFQRRTDPSIGAEAISLLVPRLVRFDELVDVVDPARLGRDAAQLFLRLHAREDVAQLLASGVSYYEVPFSFHPPDRPGEVVRGSVDCLQDRRGEA
jgi:hypothetical protein